MLAFAVLGVSTLISYQRAKAEALGVPVITFSEDHEDGRSMRLVASVLAMTFASSQLSIPSASSATWIRIQSAAALAEPTR